MQGSTRGQGRAWWVRLFFNVAPGLPPMTPRHVGFWSSQNHSVIYWPNGQLHASVVSMGGAVSPPVSHPSGAARSSYVVKQSRLAPVMQGLIVGIGLTVCKAFWGASRPSVSLNTRQSHEFPLLNVQERSWRMDALCHCSSHSGR